MKLNDEELREIQEKSQPVEVAPKWDRAHYAADVLEDAIGNIRALLQHIEALEAEREWRPIESAPDDRAVWFYVRPKTVDEAYCDTAGNHVLSKAEPRVELCKKDSWSALETADWWMEPHIPEPPRGDE